MALTPKANDAQNWVAKTCGDRSAWWSVIVSLTLHGVVGSAIFLGLQKVTPITQTQAAMTVELVAELAAPPTVPHDTPPGPQRTEARQRPQFAKSTAKLPPAPRLLSSDASISMPSITTPTQTPKESVTDPQPVAPNHETSADETSAPVSTALPPKPIAAAPTQGAPNTAQNRADQTWEGLVLAQLEKKKRYPGEAQRLGEQGVVYVHIRADRNGRIISTSIEKSARFPLLDSAVLDLVRRCNPLPAPPASIGGPTIDFVVPVEFFMSSH